MKRKFLNFKIIEKSSGKGLCFETEALQQFQITAAFEKQLEVFPDL